MSSVASDDVVELLGYALAHHGTDVAMALDRQLNQTITSLEQLANHSQIIPKLRTQNISIYHEIIRDVHRIVYRIMDRKV